MIAGDTSNPRRLVGEQTAGYVADLRVEPGTCVRITTGAPMPPGADAVIMVEYTEEADGLVTLHREVRSNAEVRPVAQDIARGQQVLQAGTCLGPQEIGLLASLGRTSVLAQPRPRWPWQNCCRAAMRLSSRTPRPDRGRFATVIGTRSWRRCSAAGTEAVSLGIGRCGVDTQEALRDKIVEGLTTCDALVTSGGVSMGKLDLIKPILEIIGQVHFGRVNMKPGKPLTFATVADKPVFALPGFPVSSLVAFEIFVRPALRQMAGHRHVLRPRVPVTLAAGLEGDAWRPEFHRVQLTRTPEGLTARSTGMQSSARLLSMVGANGLLALPKRAEPFAAGETVDAILLDHPETEPYVAE